MGGCGTDLGVPRPYVRRDVHGVREQRAGDDRGKMGVGGVEGNVGAQLEDANGELVRGVWVPGVLEAHDRGTCRALITGTEG